MQRRRARRRGERPARRPREVVAAAATALGRALPDLIAFVAVVGLLAWVAETVDWQGSRAVRGAFFAVVLAGLLGGYVGMTAWRWLHTGVRPRHARRRR